jgi:hypothetical protein
MKKQDIDQILNLAASGPSRWELDNITWHDRHSNPETLLNFLNRIKLLADDKNSTSAEQRELEILLDLASEMEQDECEELLSNNEKVVRQNFIENLARQSALEVLCNDKVSIETMRTTCKLSPGDFVLTAKRTQDLINSIRELVVQGETLSDDVAGA